MRLSAKNKFFLTLALSGAGVIALGCGFVYLVASVSDAAGSLDAIELRIREREEDQRRARMLKTTLEERSSDVARIERFFVKRDSPIEFIEYLENLARSTNNLLALDTHEISGDENLYFVVTLDGTQKTTLKYLSLLELAPFDIRIVDVDFQRLNQLDAAKTKGVSLDSRVITLIKANTR